MTSLHSRPLVENIDNKILIANLHVNETAQVYCIWKEPLSWLILLLPTETI